MFSQTQALGSQAERWVYNQLTQRGFSPKVPPNYYTPGCDMMVSNLCIEVKIATETLRRRRLANDIFTYYPRWQWNIHPTHPNEFCLILIAQTPEGFYPFILPGSMVGNRAQIQITSHPEKYNGWLAEYRDRWDVVSYLKDELYQDNAPALEHWEKEISSVGSVLGGGLL